MNLFSIVKIRTKENNNFVKILKNINENEDASFNQHKRIKYTLENYIKQDKKVAMLVKDEKDLGPKLRKTIFQHLISQTYLIQEYGKYKLKYGLPNN